MRRLIATGCLSLMAACGGPSPRPPAALQNVLLVTIDTLRADRIGAGIAPVLDRLATDGVQFGNARTVAPLTLPAHASIMTGQLPPSHGVRINGSPLSAAPSTLAERLQRAGYRTGAVVGAFVLDRRFGLARGFDHYDDDIRRDPAATDRLSAERTAGAVIDRAVAFIEAADARPWFLWTHVYDPHAPYAAPGDRVGREDTAAAYDREIAYVDAQLARLFGQLEARGVRTRTAIVVTGDHGESLGEHGEATHGMLLFEPAVRVPLILSVPGTPPSRRDEPVSLVDVMPTILTIAGQPEDALLAGRNLLAPASAPREIYVETEYPPAAGWSAAHALVQGRFKLIDTSRPQLFDLSNDALEASDLRPAQSALVQAMQRRLHELRSRKPADSQAPPASPIDPEAAARLRALGYVSTSPQPGPSSALPDAGAHIHQWAAFEQALTLEASGKRADALVRLATLARDAPESPLFQSTYARLLSEAGRHREAVARYRSIVQRWPRDAALFHELAVAARNAGDLDEALRADQASLTLTPDAPTSQNGLGLTLGDLGRHEDAARAFAAAVKADPTNASYTANLGNAYRALNRLDEAAAAYRQALQRDARLADANNGLGVVLVQQKRAADAIPFFERAIAQDGSFIEPQLNLGIALQESGQDARALEQYRRVERTAPPRSREHQAAAALRRQLQR